MCGRYTNKLTWAEIVALYRLTLTGLRIIFGRVSMAAPPIQSTW